MEKYLKMEDYFDTGDVLADGSSLHDASGVVAKVFGPSAYASYVAHAINSHDELVAMNKELLEALEFVISDKAPSYHDCIDAGEPECGWCVAVGALSAHTKSDGVGARLRKRCHPLTLSLLV